MSYEFIEDVAIADVAFEARGKNLEELFAQAARATTNVMVRDLGQIGKSERRNIAVQADNVEMLLFEFLQELIYYKDAEQLLLVEFHLSAKESDGGFRLTGYALGEYLDQHRHEQVVDVKAVTWHRFQVTHTVEGWRAFVVLDI
jgi:SHS2 domain-containing protein